MSPPKPGPGRPPRAAKAATERIEIRVTKLERLEWERCAELAGTSLSEWIRGCCHVEVHPIGPGVAVRVDYVGRHIEFHGSGDLWWAWITMWWLIGYEEEWNAEDGD